MSPRTTVLHAAIVSTLALIASTAALAQDGGEDARLLDAISVTGSQPQAPLPASSAASFWPPSR